MCQVTLSVRVGVLTAGFNMRWGLLTPLLAMYLYRENQSDLFKDFYYPWRKKKKKEEKWFPSESVILISESLSLYL